MAMKFLPALVLLAALPQARAAEAPAQIKEIKDIPYYGAGAPGGNAYREERCKLDLRFPENRKGFPTIVFFHGGGLTGGEKAIPAQLGDKEIAVVAPNYRLSGERAKCPDYIEDAAAAVAWTLKNIASYGGDPKKVFVSGMSAGGYLSAMVGMAPKYLAAHGCSNTQLAGVYPISGQMTTHFQIKNERGIPNAMTVIDEFAPMYYVGKDLPPLLFVTGDRDFDMPARAEENAFLAALLKRVAGNENVKFYELGGMDHGQAILGAALVEKQVKEVSKKLDQAPAR